MDIENLKKVLVDQTGILNTNEYMKSAVLIPLVKFDGEFHLIFEKRAEDIRQGGEICFPGGQFDAELDNNYQDTAVRETEEELGISKDKIEVIGQLKTLVGRMGIIIESFIGEIDIPNLNATQIDTTEVEKIFTTPLSYFLENAPEQYTFHTKCQPFYRDESGEIINSFPADKLNLPKRYNKPYPIQNHEIYIYKTNNEIIWGLTAKLIKEFVEVINSSSSRIMIERDNRSQINLND